MEDLLDIQPPPHVIDYWFDLLGLSLDPTLSGSVNLSDSAGFLCPFPPLDGNHYLASQAAIIDTSSLGERFIPSFEFEERPAFMLASVPSPLNQDSAQQGLRQRVFDQPGRKPAAEYEADPIKLRTSWQRRGGTDFACEWILTVFKDEVTLGALTRRLKLTETDGVNFPGGFELCLAYDGFLEKVGDSFECCLCAIGERVWWKHKKDAVRHLRKFHFGLADQCTTCHKSIYSTGEMNSHRCVPSRNLATAAAATGPEASPALAGTPN